MPIEIDTSGLAPGPYLAAVTLTPVGGTPEVVAVQISVSADKAAPVRISLAASSIEVSPRVVDFGVVDPKALSTATERVDVTNRGGTTAQVRVQGAPRWLLVKPETFKLVAGAKQVVKLVGRVDKVRGREQKVTLTFAVDGGQDQAVEVRLEVKRRGLFG